MEIKKKCVISLTNALALNVHVAYLHPAVSQTRRRAVRATVALISSHDQHKRLADGLTGTTMQSGFSCQNCRPYFSTLPRVSVASSTTSNTNTNGLNSHRGPGGPHMHTYTHKGPAL